MSSGASDWVGPLLLSNGGTINALSAVLMILNDTVTCGTGASSLLGTYQLGGANRIFDIPNTASSLAVLGTLQDGLGLVNGQLSQIGGVQKRGAGLLRLPNASSFKGPVLVEDGELIAGERYLSESAAGGVTVQAGAALTLKSAAVGAEPLTLGGTLTVAGGASSWAGPVILQVDAQPLSISAAPDASSLKISGAISGPGTLILTNGGTLELAGALSSYHSGETVLRSGLMRLNKSSGLAIPGPLTITVGSAGFESRVVLDEDQQIASNATVLLQGARRHAGSEFAHSHDWRALLAG